VLTNFAFAEDLGRDLARITGLMVEPTRPLRASYLYYGRGDSLALHRDLPRCRVTILIWLDGPVGPLNVHPELVGVPDEEYLGLAIEAGGHLSGGVKIDLRDGPLVLEGHTVPHSRPPHSSDRELVLAAVPFGTMAQSGS